MKKKTFWLVTAVHVLFWGPTILGAAFRIDQWIRFHGLTENHQLIADAINTLVALIAFYISYLFCFPLLAKKKFIPFAIYCLVCIGFSAFIGATTWSNFIKEYGVGTQYIDQYIWPISLATAARNILLSCTLRGAITWYTEIRYKQQLEKQNLQTNLTLLKAQINPHFLFNTLNNIDVLIEKDQTTASAYLKKLSDILRFTLYETPSETIPISREVEYINQYIDLQKIRTSNPDFVNFEVEIANPNLQIVPMLFIPFIENTFKHSTNKKISNAIQISISTSGNSVRFNCSNAYDADAIKTQEQSGLGLELIKSRLELLYPHNYRLDINKTSDRFTVDLSITPTP